MIHKLKVLVAALAVLTACWSTLLVYANTITDSSWEQKSQRAYLACPFTGEPSLWEVYTPEQLNIIRIENYSSITENGTINELLYIEFGDQGPFGEGFQAPLHHSEPWCMRYQSRLWLIYDVHVSSFQIPTAVLIPNPVQLLGSVALACCWIVTGVFWKRGRGGGGE